MLVVVEQIPEEGLDVRATLAQDWAREAAALALDGAADSLDFHLHLVQHLGHVRVTGDGRAAIPRTCARCGRPLRLVLSGAVDLSYSPATAARVDGALAGEAVALDAEDLDIGWYEGGSLDLAQVLSEQLALWLPDRVRCDSPGVEPPDGPCELPAQDPGPELRRNPFAGLVVPEA